MGHQTRPLEPPQSITCWLSFFMRVTVNLSVCPSLYFKELQMLCRLHALFIRPGERKCFLPEVSWGGGDMLLKTSNKETFAPLYAPPPSSPSPHCFVLVTETSYNTMQVLRG